MSYTPLRRVILMIVLMLAMTPTLASVSPYDSALASVQALLQQQSALLQHANAAARDTVPVSAIAARQLSRFHSFMTADGAPQPVDTSLLLTDIERASNVRRSTRRSAAYREAAQQVAALRAQLAAPDLQSSASGAAAKARQALDTASFQSDPLPPPSLLERLVAWLSQKLKRVHGPRGPEPDINPQFIKGLLILLAAGAFAVLVGALVQYLRQRPGRNTALALDETEAALMEARDSDSLRALAEEQARQGEWRRAFRLTFLATLVTLDTTGVLHFDRSRTNWEYLRALRSAGRGDLYRSTSPFTREFDRVWYGVARAGEADYAYAVAQFETLSAEAQPLPSPKPDPVSV